MFEHIDPNTELAKFITQYNKDMEKLVTRVEILESKIKTHDQDISLEKSIKIISLEIGALKTALTEKGVI